MKRLFLLSFTFLILSACNLKIEDEKTANEDDYDMYEMSEMSLLMEQMYADNERLKAKLLKGELPEDFPEHFLKIHSAETTKEGQKDDFFKEQSEAFVAAYQKIYDQGIDPKVQFNLAIDLCIKCHEVKCQGPIPKIQKLYIKP